MAKLKYSGRRGAGTSTAYIEVEGLRRGIEIMGSFDKQMNVEAKNSADQIADRIALRTRMAAAHSSPQAALIAPSIRTRRDRFPAVAAGGGKKVAVSRESSPAAGDLFFGAEFGGQARRTTQQFRPHLGIQGYFFWPTIRDNSAWMARRWYEGLLQIQKRWAD